MKTEKLQLSELRPYSRGYSVVVRVVLKGSVMKKPEADFVHQIVLVEDDQGDKMRAVLVADRVEHLEGKLLLYGWYEIVDAPVIASNTPWRSGPNELSFQLHLSSNIEIRTLSAPSKMKYVSYQSITDIKKRGFGATGVGVLGVALYIAEKVETLTTSDGRVTITRDIALTDFSCETPLFITMLNQLAADGCPAITLSAPEFSIISFNDMVTSTYKGFSLTTSGTTCVSKHPLGEMPDRLRKWAAEHKELLVSRRNKLLTYLGLPVVRSVETIGNLARKTVFNTRRGDCFWLRVVFKDVQTQTINAYIGCSNCEGPTAASLGTIYYCTYCFQQFCQARPCLNFVTTIVDETGEMTLALMTPQTETLFGTTAAEIFQPKVCDDTLQLHGVATYLEYVPRYVRVFAEFLESQHPFVAWKLIDLKSIDSGLNLSRLGSLKSVPEIGSCSRTVPTLSDKAVKTETHEDVYEAYVEHKPPFTFI